jgi:NAD(P)-dependent dehydrogenase (short-subunit alcohol dehydrogenase family)
MITSIPSYPSLEGKVCLITGATSGIGLVTAAALAGLGARVALTGRRPSRLQAALSHIRTQHPQAKLHAFQADFADLSQVERLASDILEKFERLDVLVNNAGAYYNRRHPTPYGEMERTLVVNHLAPFLLTQRLLERLQASAPARIVNVASGAHIYATLDFDDLGFRRGYFGMRAYARSKLANILFTYELARRLQGSGVTVNAVHPGQVATDIWRTNFPVVGPLIKGFVRLTGLTPEQGADTVIYLAASPEVEGVSGKYFVRRKPVRSSLLSYDEDAARRLWQVSEALCCLTSAKDFTKHARK